MSELAELDREVLSGGELEDRARWRDGEVTVRSAAGAKGEPKGPTSARTEPPSVLLSLYCSLNLSRTSQQRQAASWRVSGRPRSVSSVLGGRRADADRGPSRLRAQIEQVGLERDGRRTTGTLYLTPFHLVFQAQGEEDYQVGMLSATNVTFEL